MVVKVALPLPSPFIFISISQARKTTCSFNIQNTVILLIYTYNYIEFI